MEKSEYQKVKENITNDIEGTIDKIQDMLGIVCPSDCKNCDYSDLCTDSTKTTNTNPITKDSCPKCLSTNLELEDSDVAIKWYCCNNCAERFEVVQP